MQSVFLYINKEESAMVKFRTIISVLILAILLSCFSSCVGHKNWMPQDGPWFCEELQIQITFTYGDCYAIIDEKVVRCDCINDPGSKYFFVITQEEMTNLPIGTCLFEAEYVELGNTTFIVKELETGDIYSFFKGSP